MRRLLVTANVVHISPIRITLMTEVISSAETRVLTRVSRRNIPEYGILYSHRRENLKSYMFSFVCSPAVGIALGYVTVTENSDFKFR
jgi:hypothetical protein